MLTLLDVRTFFQVANLSENENEQLFFTYEQMDSLDRMLIYLYHGFCIMSGNMCL